MSHSLIVGMTSSGKSTLAKQLATLARARGRRVIVLDPTHDIWDCDFQTSDNETFLDIFWSPAWLSCDVFIDESGDAIGQYDKIMLRTATLGRKQGHSVRFISQRCAQLSPTVRGQCEELFLFRMGTSDAKVLAAEWCQDELNRAFQLPKGSCFYVSRYGALQTIKVF